MNLSAIIAGAMKAGKHVVANEPMEQSTASLSTEATVVTPVQKAVGETPIPEPAEHLQVVINNGQRVSDERVEGQDQTEEQVEEAAVVEGQYSILPENNAGPTAQEARQAENRLLHSGTYAGECVGLKSKMERLDQKRARPVSQVDAQLAEEEAALRKQAQETVEHQLANLVPFLERNLRKPVKDGKSQSAEDMKVMSAEEAHQIAKAQAAALRAFLDDPGNEVIKEQIFSPFLIIKIRFVLVDDAWKVMTSRLYRSSKYDHRPHNFQGF